MVEDQGGKALDKKEEYAVLRLREGEAHALQNVLEMAKSLFAVGNNYYVLIAVKNIMQVLEKMMAEQGKQDICSMELHILELDVLCYILENNLVLIKDDEGYREVLRFHKRCDKVYGEPKNIIQMAELLSMEHDKLGFLYKELLRIRNERASL